MFERVKSRCLFTLFLLLFTLPGLPAAAQGEGSPLDAITAEARVKIVAAMKSEAQKMGFETGATLTFQEADGSMSAFLPIKGVENLTPEDLKRGVTLGLLMASTPEGSEAPSGVFRVHAQASESGGRFTILDSSGKVVQEGDLEIEANEGAEAARVLGREFPKFAIYPYYHWGCITYVYYWPWGRVYIRYCWCWWPYNFWYGGCFYYPHPYPWGPFHW